MKRAIIYVRKNLLHQDTFIEQQKNILLNFAYKKKYKVMQIIEDYGLASQDKRQGLKKIFKLLSDNENKQRRKINVFLVFNEEAISIVDRNIFKQYLSDKDVEFEVYLKDYHGDVDENITELMYIIQNRINLLGIKRKKKKQILHGCLNALSLMK